MIGIAYVYSISLFEPSFVLAFHTGMSRDKITAVFVGNSCCFLDLLVIFGYSGRQNNSWSQYVEPIIGV